MAGAFAALAELAGGAADAEAALAAALDELRSAEGGDLFVEQVDTARRVLGA